MVDGDMLVLKGGTLTGTSRMEEIPERIPNMKHEEVNKVWTDSQAALVRDNDNVTNMEPSTTWIHHDDKFKQHVEDENHGHFNHSYTFDNNKASIRHLNDDENNLPGVSKQKEHEEAKVYIGKIHYVPYPKIVTQPITTLENDKTNL